MSGCGPMDFIDGGTFRNPNIIGGILNNVSLTGGVILDAATIAAIVDQILPTLLAALTSVPVGSVATSTDESLTTTLIGSRDKLLGAPEAFVTLGDYKVPAYR